MKINVTKWIMTAAVVAAGAGFLIYSSMGHAQYYKMVDELMITEGEANPNHVSDEWVGKTMRVHGYVEAGSIDENIVAQKTIRTFTLEHKGKTIKVRHEGPKPDTFKDLSEVVAKGTIVKETVDGKVVHILEATELMAKCPSKYEGAPGNKNLGKKTNNF